MHRRTFLRTTLATGAGAGLTLGSGAAASAHSVPAQPQAQPFKLKYAPHTGMFTHHAGEDPIEQIKFMADAGFRAFEDNWMRRREPELQERIGQTLADLGMEMGVFVGHGESRRGDLLAQGDEDTRNAFVAELRESVEVAKRCGATWMTIIPGSLHHRLEMDYQTANVVEALKRGAEVLEPHGLVMVLEALNPFVNHPDMFLSKIPQGYLICKAVDSPACKILFDMYHQQITEGNIINNIDLAWEEIGYFQIGDVPGRKEPTTGEMNYRNIFRHIHGKGWTGILGMEHGNAREGLEGERALIEAYRSVDDFQV